MCEISTEVNTKVCKVCGEEKPVYEFHKREGNYYRTECKVCTYINKNKLITNEIWNINEYKIIIDSLLNSKVEYINEIIPFLNNKSLIDIANLLSTNLRFGSIPLKFTYPCDNCGKNIILKPYEILENNVRFCCSKCNAEYRNANNAWGMKPSEKPDWITDINEFIENYEILGLYESSKLYNKNRKTIAYWAEKFNLNRINVVNNLSSDNIIKIYKLILKGKLCSFPNGFTNNYNNKVVVLKFLIENILNWDVKTICDNFSMNILEEFKLDSVIKINESKEIISKEYNINLWEFKKHINFPHSFWNEKSNITNALIWFKEKLSNELNINNIFDLYRYNFKDLIHVYNMDALCITQFNRDICKFYSRVFSENIHKESDVIVKQKCSECNETKDFTNEYFPANNKFNIFNLKGICLECIQKRDNKNFYAKKGIFYENIEDILPEQWWEHFYSNKITQMPKHCYSQSSMINIVRHIVFNKMNIYTKEDICSGITCPSLYKYKIQITQQFETVLNTLQLCFPEFNITEEDINPYNNNNAVKIINTWMLSNNITVDKILNSYGISGLFDRTMMNLWQHKKRKDNLDCMNLFIWYFKLKNIKHPVNNKEIIDLDFTNKTDGFWDIKENRIRAIKYYCEFQCEESILDKMKSWQNLQQWVLKYFSKQKLKPLYTFTTFKIDTYDLLIESYPKIKENNLLFSWELIRNTNTAKESLVLALRQFVLYRLDDICADIVNDLPIYLHSSYMSDIYPKFNAYLSNNGNRKRHFESYYEWACLAFSEYKDCWKPEDFGVCLAYDGTRCNSKQEVMIYEFVKKELKMDNFYSIGMKHSGKYVYKFDNHIFKKICPDFVMEFKNSKPIIFEYYGLYLKNYNEEKIMLKSYHEKIKFKNDFYKSNNEIYFIDLYPSDLKNHFNGVKEKINTMIKNINDII